MQGSSKARGRRGYDVAFRQRALSRLASGDTSLRQVAKEFDVSVPTLIKWRKEENLAGKSSRTNTEVPKRGQETGSAELQRLREEVEQLKQERDRLRQGIAVLVGIKVSQ